jgi:hypothetical protein
VIAEATLRSASAAQIERPAPWAAEDAAREALQLRRPHGDRESPKYEKAAMRWLERYLPGELTDVAALRGDDSEPPRAKAIEVGMTRSI